VLRADRVDVWRIDADSPSDAFDAPPAWLSADERERADRFLSESARCTFVGVRSALRNILGRYVSRSPYALRFSYDQRGKPSLVGPEPLHFNVSHSGAAAVVAVASKRVGIDLEELRSVPPDVAAEALADEERECVHAAADGVASFFAHWTLKEAYLKGTGYGLSVPLSSVRVTPGELQHIGGFHVANLDVRDGFAAAIAVESGGRRHEPFPSIRLLDWVLSERAAAKAS
jgi:4'-phosphopantetheinyl transferase